VEEEATIAAAELLRSALEGGTRLEGLPDQLRPRDLAEGYAIQAALGELLGSIVGWKLAATGATARRNMGLEEPIAGRLFERLRRESPAELPVDGQAMGVAEAEFALLLGRDLPLRDRGYAVEEVAAAVAAIHPAIEVPDSRFRDYRTLGAPQIAADSALAGCFVLGPAARDWRHLDLGAHPVTIAKEGVEVACGSGAAVMGGPLLALAWLANRQEHGGLRRGQVVLTGSATAPVPIAPGEQIVADFGELGAIRASFAAGPDLSPALADA
jgi:2-keto-4-pentenoate hydratase